MHACRLLFLLNFFGSSLIHPLFPSPYPLCPCCSPCLRLLEVHAKHERVPPAVFRRLLQRALDVFPYNPEFLSAFIALEAQYVCVCICVCLCLCLCLKRTEVPCTDRKPAFASLHLRLLLLLPHTTTSARHSGLASAAACGRCCGT